MEPEFLDSPAVLATFLSNLGDCDGQPPRFYMDLEGDNLSREGTLSLVTILLEPEKTVHLVDVTTLGQQAFTTAGRDGRTLQGILESTEIVKVFFDIRNDSDALFSLHGIRVACVEDLQLMEFASRSFAKRNVNGLAKCIERDSTIDFLEKGRWRAVKERGKRLFGPPDVTLMPHLRDMYRGKLCDMWWRKIETETDARIRLSQSPTFVDKGQHMAQGPCEWTDWRPRPAEVLSRTLLQVRAPRVPASTTSVTPSTNTTAPEQPGGRGELADMLHRVALTGPDVDSYLDAASDDSDVITGFGGGRGYNDSGSDGFRDLIACDKECGYCGCCDY